MIDGAWEAFFDDDGALVIGGVVGDPTHRRTRGDDGARGPVDERRGAMVRRRRWRARARRGDQDRGSSAPSPSLYASTGKSWRRVAASPSRSC